MLKYSFLNLIGTKLSDQRNSRHVGGFKSSNQRLAFHSSPSKTEKGKATLWRGCCFRLKTDLLPFRLESDNFFHVVSDNNSSFMILTQALRKAKSIQTFILQTQDYSYKKGLVFSSRMKDS